MKHAFITIPLIFVIVVAGVLALAFCAVFTVFSWVFEVATDWLYKACDDLWIKYCELNAKYKNK